MQSEQAHILPDGRLHLHYGPIDLLIGVTGAGQKASYGRAVARFDGLLQGLVDELVELQKPLADAPQLTGPVARQMLTVVRPFAGQFVTPMAAVAGAVADYVLAGLSGPDIQRAYVNNGGDIAVYLGKNQNFTGAIPEAGEARLHLAASQPWRGVATSGWRGRSLSFGIADSVTVIAKTAATADVAATMIANAVDLPDHPAIKRQKACAVIPDSDLGARRVTVAVAALSEQEISRALNHGQKYAAGLARQGLIGGALLVLQGQTMDIGGTGFRLNNKEIDYAEV